MSTKIQKPKQSLNKAFLKVKPNRTEIEGFKSNLIQLIDRSNEIESEEFHKNLEVNHLIVTNINEWFIFDAQNFDRHFAQNKALVKQFEEFEGGRLAETKTDFFYKHIAEPEIVKVKAQIDFTYLDIRSYDKPLRNSDKKDDAKLIALYKLLSPEHLLKLPFANDSNSLDKRFYSELLRIIGLTETKEGGKKLIGRSKAGERNSGSILEDVIIQLDSLYKLSQLEKTSRPTNLILGWKKIQLE